MSKSEERAKIERISKVIKGLTPIAKELASQFSYQQKAIKLVKVGWYSKVFKDNYLSYFVKGGTVLWHYGPLIIPLAPATMVTYSAIYGEEAKNQALLQSWRLHWSRRPLHLAVHLVTN